MEDKLMRLCYLIELRNIEYRARNNAYLRRRTALKFMDKVKGWDLIDLSSNVCMLSSELPYVKLRFSKAKRKSKLEDKLFKIHSRKAVKVSKLYNREIKALVNDLGCCLRRMSMCPIIQTIFFRTGVKHLNGKAIRDQATQYTVETILLK